MFASARTFFLVSLLFCCIMSPFDPYSPLIFHHSSTLYIYICDRIWQKPAWTHTSNKIHFPPTIDRSIHGLTIDVYFTVHSSLVCFPRGLFLWPVWRPRVHGCSSNGPGASWQIANCLKTSSKVDIDVRNWFGNILKGFTVENDHRRGLLSRSCD